ncbi:nascent polypeptide-associated complex subunit alpha, muscle-specific form-like [Eleginops maclovinus]|uniref:nascent polypeptide-associated complex subunit alpha, muscle-specific form-like n=1 Tax=Eleginops maclovinus TaxID=56733 RepID=UPI0030805BA5
MSLIRAEPEELHQITASASAAGNMDLTTSLRTLWLCLLLSAPGEGFPATSRDYVYPYTAAWGSGRSSPRFGGPPLNLQYGTAPPEDSSQTGNQSPSDYVYPPTEAWGSSGGSEPPSGGGAPSAAPPSYEPNKFIETWDSNQPSSAAAVQSQDEGSGSPTAPPPGFKVPIVWDQPPSEPGPAGTSDEGAGVATSRLVHSVSPAAWNQLPMLDFGEGPVPYIGAPGGYHLGPGSFPFGIIESVESGIADGTAAGFVDGPVPSDGATRYTNADPTEEGRTGGNTALVGGFVDGPYDGATRYTNAAPTTGGQTGSNPASTGRLDEGLDPRGGQPTGFANPNPVTKDSQTGSNPVMSYDYGGFPFGHMDSANKDVAESNTPASGFHDGPDPYSGATQYSNAGYPVTNDVVTESRAIPSSATSWTVGGPDPKGGPALGVLFGADSSPSSSNGQTFVKQPVGGADEPPYDPYRDPAVGFSWVGTSLIKPNNWRPQIQGPGLWEPNTETPASNISPPLPSSYIVQSRSGYWRQKEVLSHTSYSPKFESRDFEAPRRRTAPGSLSIAGTKVF